MKFNLILIMLFTNLIFSQNAEFKIYDNGLIYSNNTMDKLQHIADSLNLKFKVCDSNKNFYSQKTAVVNYLRFESDLAENLKNDIEKGLSYNQIIKKYTEVIKTEKLILTKFNYKNNNSKNNTYYYTTLETENNDSHYLDFNESEVINETKGSWIYKFHKKSKYSESSIRCFYIVESFKSKMLPKKYSDLVSYSECIIDTNTNIFFKNAKNNMYTFFTDTINNNILIFNDYVNSKLNMPIFPRKEYKRMQELNSYFGSKKNINILTQKELEMKDEKDNVTKVYYKYNDNFSNWYKKKLDRVDSLKNNDINFLKLLKEAVVFMEENSVFDEELEDYIGKYISKEKALYLKRGRLVMGSCSMDNSPRVHAQKITFLAAETFNWDVFVRGHLDIMNDNFKSVAYSNFGQIGRKTYIKELEELNINTIDLLLGICFKIDKPSDNHYFGSVARIGIALSESNFKDEFEQKVASIIKDHDLDDYNRIMFFYLYKNYIYNLKDDSRKLKGKSILNLAYNSLPKYIKDKVSID